MEGILGLNTISGGVQNEQEMSGAATIKGGRENSIFGDASAIGGGWQNKVENHHSSVIIGGFSNSIPLPSIGPGVCGTLLGGNSNTGGMIFGGEECAVLTRNSWGGGRQAQVLAGPPGSLGNRDSFVWADSQDAAYPSNGPFTFNIRAQGGVYYGAPPPKWWDIAEEMVVHKADNLQEAELVSLSGNDILAKTKVAYDENLIGVVTGSRTTTMHFQSIGEPEDLKLEEKYITLVGRVYVKVNNENGPIKVGSPITSSSVPGIGMQATRPAKIIGYAMTEANFTDSDTEEVLVFANLGYYVPQEAFAALQDRLASLKKKVNKLKKIALR